MLEMKSVCSGILKESWRCAWTVPSPSLASVLVSDLHLFLSQPKSSTPVPISSPIVVPLLHICTRSLCLLSFLTIPLIPPGHPSHPSQNNVTVVDKTFLICLSANKI